ERRAPVDLRQAQPVEPRAAVGGGGERVEVEDGLTRREVRLERKALGEAVCPPEPPARGPQHARGDRPRGDGGSPSRAAERGKARAGHHHGGGEEGEREGS